MLPKTFLIIASKKFCHQTSLFGLCVSIKQCTQTWNELHPCNQQKERHNCIYHDGGSAYHACLCFYGCLTVRKWMIPRNAGCFFCNHGDSRLIEILFQHDTAWTTEEFHELFNWKCDLSDFFLSVNLLLLLL